MITLEEIFVISADIESVIGFYQSVKIRHVKKNHRIVNIMIELKLKSQIELFNHHSQS